MNVLRRSTNHRHVTLVAALVAGLVAMTCPGRVAAQDATIVMKLASPTINDVQHEWMRRFAAAIEKKTNGRIKAEVYPAGQLGSIPRMIEGTQLGSIQIFTTPPEFFAGVDPRFELLAAPALFESEQHAVKTISDPEFSKAFLALGADKGLVGVSLYFAGPTGLVTRTPFRTLDDFKGKKIRVLASPFQTEQITRLGATGVPLSFGDVLPALQQGTIDGALSTLPVVSALHYQATAKYMNETGQSYIFVVAVVSKRWLDTLPADLQAAVLATGHETEANIGQWEIDFLARQRKTWVDNGGELIALTAADKAEMMAKLGSVGDDIVSTKPVLKPLWDQLVAAAKQRK
jgi:TRAP-type transport system periplasmic protein